MGFTGAERWGILPFGPRTSSRAGMTCGGQGHPHRKHLFFVGHTLSCRQLGHVHCPGMSGCCERLFAPPRLRPFRRNVDLSSLHLFSHFVSLLGCVSDVVLDQISIKIKANASASSQAANGFGCVHKSCAFCLCHSCIVR